MPKTRLKPGPPPRSINPSLVSISVRIYEYSVKFLVTQASCLHGLRL